MNEETVKKETMLKRIKEKIEKRTLKKQYNETLVFQERELYMKLLKLELRSLKEVLKMYNQRKRLNKLIRERKHERGYVT